MAWQTNKGTVGELTVPGGAFGSLRAEQRRVQFYAPQPPPGGLVAAVEHVSDLVDSLGPRRGVAGGGAQVDVPEPGGDFVDGDAGLEQVGGPVGAERVGVREPLGHAGGMAVTAHEPVHRDRGEGERVPIAVAAEAHEQRLLVEQPDAARERMDRRPGLERLLDGLGDGDLALAAALAVHVEPVVAGVRARTAQIAGPQAAQLGRAQPAVAEHPQQRVVALARDRAPVGDAQEVGVVGVGQRLRRPGLVPGTRTPSTSSARPSSRASARSRGRPYPESMSWAPLPEHAVYLDDKHSPVIPEWEWVRTVKAFTDRMAAGDVQHISLDFDLSRTDYGHSGLDAVRWMAKTGTWPTASVQLHTGDYQGRKQMAALITSSGLFNSPEDHPLGKIYRRRG